jgi:Glycosyltransferase like family 2
VDDDFLAPGSGLVLGRRANGRAAVADALLDARAALKRESATLDQAAAQAPRRRVLALAVERTDVPNLLCPARRELARSRHDVTFAAAPAEDRGKFENLNALLERHPASEHDWLLVLDDDVALPPAFLDRFLAAAEHFDFALAQPAHRHRSHAAWPVTRRQPALARRTQFVEIGPVTAFRADTFETLLPFPPLRMGWGLDAHWAAVAQERGWAVGIVDATPIRHGMRRTGSGYAHADAVAEARAFLEERPYVTRADAGRVLATYRSWQR